MDTTRDLYKNDIDFSQLALQDKEFNKYLKTNGQVNFGDPEAVRQLTISLLRRDFNLALTLPPDRLCPPVPNRLNYILWIQDLLAQTYPSLDPSFHIASSSPQSRSSLSRPAPLFALDIGTGSSAIYPLLFLRTPHPASSPYSWPQAQNQTRFIATDIDATNLDFARRSVTANGLDSQIKILERKATDTLIPTDLIGDNKELAFVMCNPPFYESTTDLLTSAKLKSRPPFSACTGAEVEMVVQGGEVAFVRRIIDESVRNRDRSKQNQPGSKRTWYTSMLGKLSSLTAIISHLKAAGCTNWCVTEFVQGNRTRRWAVGWSWGGWRPGVAVARGLSSSAEGAIGKRALGFPSEMSWALKDGDAKGLGRRVDEVIGRLGVRWTWEGSGLDGGTGVGSAQANVWSRSARRKRRNKVEGDEMEEDTRTDEEMEEPALGFKVTVKEDEGKDTEVHARWLMGKDSVLFESFCGMLKRSLSGD